MDIFDVWNRANGFDSAKNIGRGIREKFAGVEEIGTAEEIKDRAALGIQVAEGPGRPGLNGLELAPVELRPSPIEVRGMRSPSPGE